MQKTASRQIVKKSFIFCWNPWSISSKTKKLQNFLQILAERNVSTACVTESWFDVKNGVFSRLVTDAGYKLHHAYRTDKRGGRVATIY